MKGLTAAFAASVLAVVTAACTPPAPAERPENFNPVREQLQQHGLMQAAQADSQGKAICAFDRDAFERVLTAGDRAWFTERGGKGLMFTFYMCGAIGAPGFEDNPFNDAVVHPAKGRTAEQAKGAIRTELAAQEIRLCGGLTGDPAQDDPFIAKFCAALKPST